MKGKLKKIKQKFLKKIDFDYKKYCKNNILFLTFFVTSFINGTLVRVLTVKNILDIRPMIADMALILIIGSFGYLFKPKNRFKYYFVWTIIYVISCVVNSMYYTNYLSFSSISLLATSLLIVDVGDAIVENVMEIKDFSYLWSIIAMILVQAKLRRIGYYQETDRFETTFKKTIITGILFLLIFAVTLRPTDIGRLTKQWNREYIVMRYGIYTYQMSDLIASTTPAITSMFGYDQNAKKFRDYYKENAKVKEKNEYSDIFEGKNVLVIHAESIQKFVMDTTINDTELTPNLNKLANEGIFFSNFYAEESVGTSSDSEFTFSTSLMPATSGTVAINYWDRKYPSIQKLLKEKNYYVYSMHGNNCSFWNRNLLHQSLGYDKFYCHTNDYDIDETIGLGLSDKSFFKQSVEHIKEINKNNEKWYGTLIMLTNHTPFSYITPHSDLKVNYTYKEKNKEGIEEEKTQNYMENTVLGNYFKSVHYADEAIGELIERMDKENLLDNTVLVIYGDHDAKIKKSEYEYYYNYDFKTGKVLDSSDPNYHEITQYEYELNRKVPFIIWTKDKKYNVEEKEVMGMIDILPTLGNMLGIENKYALGNDIFSTNENTVVFSDGNWITNKMYYNTQKEEALLLDANYPISVDYIEEHSKKAEEKIAISNSLIVYDLLKDKNNVKEEK